MKPRSLELIDALKDPNAKSAGSNARAIADEHGVEIYHLRHLAWALEYCGFTGHTVLEVGGSLPPSLIREFTDAEKWVCVEYIPYYDEIHSSLGKEYKILEEVLDPRSLEIGQVAAGAIENLPESWRGKFDSIFSVACFEHIAKLPLGLAAMADALVTQGLYGGGNKSFHGHRRGRLYAGFAPIWSSATGYHMSITQIPDLDPSVHPESIFFDYMHLLMSPVELYIHLRDRIGAKSASHVVYHVHHSNHINRFFIPDYFAALRLETRFSGTISPYARRPVQAHLKKEILRRHPMAVAHEYDGLVIRVELC